MKKRLFILATILVLAFATCFSFSVASAEEPSNLPTETVESTVEDKVAELTAIINKLKSDESKEFFNTTILPIVLGVAVAFFGGLAMLFPFLKKARAFNKLKETVQALSTRNADLQTILNSTDVAQISESIKRVLGEEVSQKINDLYIMYKENTALNEENKTELALIEQQIKAIISAMSIAYSSRSECVAALQTAPEKNVVKNLEKENEQLKNYIRETKGEEANEIIKSLGV